MAMQSLPDLSKINFKEWGELAINAEHIIDWELIPRGANLQYQDVFIALGAANGDANRSGLEECMTYQLDCWIIPVYGSDATETVDSRAGIKNLYDMYVPKSEDTDPNAALTLTETDVEIGDDDNSLIYQPGKISLMALADPGKPARIVHRRPWLGRHEGKFVRVADNLIRFSDEHKLTIKRAYHANTPTYIVWVLTIPNNVADGAFEERTTFPKNTDWVEWDFLAPQWDPILGVRSNDFNSGATALNAWRAWSTHWMVEQGDKGRQWQQRPLYCRVARRTVFSRSIAQHSTTPDQS